MTQRSLFPVVDEGFAKGYFYDTDFLSAAEESDLVESIRGLPLAPAEYKEFLAKRRVVSYGGRYDFSAQRLTDTEPIPAFLEPLRRRIASWAGRPPAAFSHALIAEYAEGTQLGWHRDMPQFELVVGVSLLGPCRKRFRRYPPRQRERSIAVELAPKSSTGSNAKRAGSGSIGLRRRPRCAIRSRSGRCARPPPRERSPTAPNGTGSALQRDVPGGGNPWCSRDDPREVEDQRAREADVTGRAATRSVC